jgi:hypothetical protein
MYIYDKAKTEISKRMHDTIWPSIYIYYYYYYYYYYLHAN